MGKGRLSTPTKSVDAQFARTAANLKRKGKTNKKLKRNKKASQYAF
jgi:hypothetical protein